MCLDPLIKDYSSPLLFHPDLHKRNIFVSDDDPGTVIAIIDWQGSAVEPAFWYRWDVPDFVGMELVRPYQVLPGEEGEEVGEQQQAQAQAQTQAKQQEQTPKDEEEQQEQKNQEKITARSSQKPTQLSPSSRSQPYQPQNTSMKTPSAPSSSQHKPGPPA